MDVGTLPPIQLPELQKTDAAAPVAAPTPAPSSSAPAAPPTEAPFPVAKLIPPDVNDKNFGKNDARLRDVLARILDIIEQVHTQLCEPDKAKKQLQKALSEISERFRPDVKQAANHLRAAIDAPPGEKGALVKQMAALVPVTVDDHAGATLRDIAKKLEATLLA